jgi:beta-lactamase regulating signal transducer with metallopeptidase domain
VSWSALALWLASLQLAGAGVLGLAAILDRVWDRICQHRSAATRRSVWALAIMLAVTLLFARLLLPAPALALPGWSAVALIGLWSLGVALLGLRWLHGIVLTRRIVGAATPIHTGPWRDSLAALEPHVGPVELRVATDIPGPMLAGGLRPIILIPSIATTLELPSAAERRAILTHELAHLCRADNTFLHLGVVVRAIYWINPLAWWSLRRLRETAEVAADDAVLESGATPASYAAQLVASARAQLERAGRVAAGQLRARVEAILDGTRQREPIERRRPSLAVARLLGAAVLLASLATACEARSDDRDRVSRVGQPESDDRGP